jgi:protoporphyrinogen oxidase
MPTESVENTAGVDLEKAENPEPKKSTKSKAKPKEKQVKMRRPDRGVESFPESMREKLLLHGWKDAR